MPLEFRGQGRQRGTTIANPTCAQYQDAYDRAVEARDRYAISPIKLPGLQELLDKAIQDARDEITKAGCVLVEPKPTNVYAPLIDALVAGVEFSITELAAFFAGLEEQLKPAVRAMALAIQERLVSMGFKEQAANLETSGNVFGFLGSLQDVIVDRARLTTGPLSFEELLQYENRLTGMRTAIVLTSWIFAQAVEFVTFGQVKSAIGLLIHIVDDVVGDAARIVSTQLFRRGVGDPLAEGYKLVHRTGLLTASAASKAYELALIEDEELVDALARDGLNDRAIQVTTELARLARIDRQGEVALRTRRLTAAQLEDLYKKELVDRDKYVKGLALEGFTDESIELLVAAADVEIAAKRKKTG